MIIPLRSVVEIISSPLGKGTSLSVTGWLFFIASSAINNMFKEKSNCSATLAFLSSGYNAEDETTLTHLNPRITQLIH